MTLTEEQKEFIRKEAVKNPNLTHITQACFDNTSIDGRSAQGKAVRKFLVDNEISFSTSRRKKSDAIVLTEEQKEFVAQEVGGGLNSFRIAEMLFPDSEVKQLGLEQRAVLAQIEIIGPERVAAGDESALCNYVSPKSASRIVKKINDATGSFLEDGKLNRKYESFVEKLGINLNNSRFRKIVNNYTNRSDRELFEQEFIRLTWDKPDLSADELNLYLNVCKEIINLEVVSSHLNKLNDMFDVADEQQEMSVRLAEIIKTKSDEYHKCESRIENLTKKLQGERGERLKNKIKANASILSIVNLFQEEEERKNMVRIAELQKLAVRDEAARLESMEEWVARIVGVEKEDVV